LRASWNTPGAMHIPFKSKKGKTNFIRFSNPSVRSERKSSQVAGETKSCL
jgi:hypothetical protein